MLKLLRNRKGQNTMEYALLLAIVVGAISGMQLYLRRGINARLKAGSDNVPTATIAQTLAQTDLGAAGITTASAGSVFSDGTFTKQYDPYYSREGAMDMTTESNEGTERETIDQAGGIRRLDNATTTRTGNQTITGMKTTAVPNTRQE